MPEKNKFRPIIFDFKAIRERREKFLGRPLTEVEKNILFEVDAIIIDSLACGIAIETTITNIEKNGDKVSDAVKSFLGLIPSVN